MDDDNKCLCNVLCKDDSDDSDDDDSDDEDDGNENEI